MDIFSTMEVEMKQIMDLFAKERKARKREMVKLKTKVKDRDQQIHTEREKFNKEKNETVQKWK